jgi:hypothetical protein
VSPWQTEFLNDTHYQTWRDEYRAKRYLERATDADLTQRLDDILVNFIRFLDDGRAVVRSPLESNPLTPLVIHVLEEVKLRGHTHYSFQVKHFHLDSTKYPNVGRAAALWREKGLTAGAYLLKFGKVKFLEPLLSRGAIRVCPASFYRDPLLVPSIRDNELQFDQFICGTDVRIQSKDGRWHSPPLVGPVRLTQTAESDYYFSSYSVLFEHRLFDDFEADGCIIVKDPNEFCKRLAEAFRGALPAWTCQIGGVQYLDPLRPTPSPDICFAKHFRYSYQKEFRMVWLPPQEQKALGPLCLELGDLSSFCELVRL